jgi:hypothetical protein
MAKRGPAPIYKPENCPIAYKFCLLGATNEDLAGLFKVSLASIGNWLARHPEFRKAVQDGRDVADADVALLAAAEGQGLHPIDVKVLQIEGDAKQVEYNRYFPPDSQAAILCSRNRRRKQWRELIELGAQRHRREAARARGSRHPGAQCPPPLTSTRRRTARSAPSAAIPWASSCSTSLGHATHAARLGTD